ncbi:MAG: hypothetical protein ACQEWG_15305 [Bacteroidota bacterium]
MNYTKNLLFSLAFILLQIYCCNAQQITTEKVFGGYKYSLNGENLNLKELSGIVQANQEAYLLLKKARTKSTIANILAGIGGGFTGYGFGQSFGEGSTNWGLVAAGAGIFVVSIPFTVTANKNARESVQMYNSSLEEADAFNVLPIYKIIGNRNGVGLALVF